MNSAVLTGPGTYRYVLVTQAEARQWLETPRPYVSRVGYQATADHIWGFANQTVALSREPTVMAPGDEALVVRLKYRLEDPSRKAGYQPRPDDWEYGLLVRIA